MRGTSSDGLFLSQSATSLSSKFWKQCFSGVRNANSQREGETGWNPFSHSIEPQQQEGLPSLASAVSSLSVLYKRWKETLSRNSLKDFVLGEDPELFFKRGSDGGFTEDYGPICTMECWQPAKKSPGYDIGTRTSRKRPVRRSASARLVRERSHTTNYKRAPEPRGVSDGNGRCAWVLTGGDGSERVVKSSGSEPTFANRALSSHSDSLLSGKDTKNVEG